MWGGGREEGRKEGRRNGSSEEVVGKGGLACFTCSLKVLRRFSCRVEDRLCSLALSAETSRRFDVGGSGLVLSFSLTCALAVVVPRQRG